jgi:alpha-glucoside transport system substrate-binding protein
VQVTFTQSIADVFGEKPRSAMLFEGDFVVAEINRLDKVQVGSGARFFNWPSINGSRPAVVTAGDQAVAFTDTPEANALMAFIASTDAAAIMAQRGGFLSPNRNLDVASYPDDTMRSLAAALINAEVLRFDLSDLTPLAFGGATNAHMWVLLQEFLSKPIPAADMARQLEEAANRDFGGT